MPPKRKGALQVVHGEVDEIKTQVRHRIVLKCFSRCRSNSSVTADELAPVGNYDQRKQEEERRLQTILERLNTLSLEISPDVSKEDSEDEDDEDSNDNDADSDEVVKRASKPPFQSVPRIYTVLSEFRGEQEGDLSVQVKGDVLRIINMAADGWWLAQDSQGNRGVVPKTFLKIGSGIAQDDDDDDDDEEDESEEEEEQDGGELTDDGEKKRFNILISFLSFSQIDTTDVLSAMGAIPSGFRASTLNKLFMEEGATYRGSHYIQPELSHSQLSFSDLFLDPDTGRVRAREVRTCVCFTLWGCRMIPAPGVGVQVLSRHIRLCASDRTQVLSNIHTVRATYNPKSPKTWSFSPRMTGILSTLLDGDCFLRCNSASPDLGILFELGVAFIRNSTGERGELSCGWAFLKLTDDSGNPLPSRYTHMTRTQMQIYHFRLCSQCYIPKLLEILLLPDSLLHCLSCVHLLALHRQLLADTLLMDRPTMQDADLICSPILSTFPVLLDQPDLMDALRVSNKCTMVNLISDFSYLKQEFIKVYMSSVYFLLHSPSLPCHRWADPPSEEQRARVIYNTLNSLKHTQHTHLAFDVSELAFDLLCWNI
uniref:SH3 domain-containing protein n=1 Tax=Mola mola TaxID=94237 RepID=A0A3Q3WL50_MOLML